MACVNVAPATFPVFVYLYCVSIFVNLYLCFCIAVGTACVNVAPAAFPGTTMSPWQSRNTTYNSIFCSVWRFQRTRCIMIFCQLWACCVCEFRTWMRLLCLSLGTFLCSWLKVEVNRLSLHFCLNKDQQFRMEGVSGKVATPTAVLGPLKQLLVSSRWIQTTKLILRFPPVPSKHRSVFIF